MINSTLQEEQQHLEEVKNAIDNYRKTLSGHVEGIENEYKEVFKNIRDPYLTTNERFWSVFNAIEKYEQSGISQYSKHLLELTEIQDCPYFARVDFNLEPIYIGKFAFYDSKSKTIVTDWRAPAAALYYNYSKPTKEASYRVTLGNGQENKFLGELSLKRNIEIQNGKIVSLFDNDAEKLEYLRENLSHQTGGLLHDIVTTIQDDQNQIIRLPLNARMIVQGSVGSGKTTIAVHRLSYLFYNYADKINKDNTLIITPSPVLLSYISKTLPNIGIYETTCLTFFELVKRTLRGNGIRCRLSETGSKELDIKYLENQLENVKKTTIRKLAKNPLCFRYELIKEYTRLEELEVPPTRALEQIKKQLNKELTKIKNKVHVEVVEDKIKQFQKEYVTIKGLQDYLQTIVDGIRDELLASYASSLNLDEASQLFYLYGKAVGFKRLPKFQQIILDEAQDLSQSNYLIVKELSKRSGLTILGDLNQQTKEGAVRTWDEVKEVVEGLNLIKLDISYRSTKEITDFSSCILSPFVSKELLPQSFERHGSQVELKEFKHFDELLLNLQERINVIQKEKHVSISVVTCNPKEHQQTFFYLKDKINNVLEIKKGFNQFSEVAVYVCPKELVKGLEFETVFLINPSEESFPKGVRGAKDLYVCSSRAINNLQILHTSQLSGLLNL